MQLPSLPVKPMVPSENGDDIILELKYDSSTQEKKKKTSQVGLGLNIFDELNSWLIMNSPIKLEDKGVPILANDNITKYKVNNGINDCNPL